MQIYFVFVGNNFSLKPLIQRSVGTYGYILFEISSLVNRRLSSRNMKNSTMIDH